MIVGFLGTVIGLERAVALQKPWAYGAPIFAVLSAIAQVSGLPARLGETFAVISSVILLAIFCYLWWHQHESYLFIIGLGAVSWLVGNSLWLGDYPYFISASWWAGFLVLTITGERLELSRLRRLSHGSRLLLFSAIAVFVLGLSRMSISEPGSRVAGVGLIGIALWLLRWDIAWRTIRIAGLSRFMAAVFTFRIFLASCGRDSLDYLRWRLYRRTSLRCHASFDLLGICLRDDLCARSHYSALGNGGLTSVPEVFLCASNFASPFAIAAYWRRPCRIGIDTHVGRSVEWVSNPGFFSE